MECPDPNCTIKQLAAKGFFSLEVYHVIFILQKLSLLSLIFVICCLGVKPAPKES